MDRFRLWEYFIRYSHHHYPIDWTIDQYWIDQFIYWIISLINWSVDCINKSIVRSIEWLNDWFDQSINQIITNVRWKGRTTYMKYKMNTLYTYWHIHLIDKSGRTYLISKTCTSYEINATCLICISISKWDISQNDVVHNYLSYRWDRSYDLSHLLLCPYI